MRSFLLAVICLCSVVAPGVAQVCASTEYRNQLLQNPQLASHILKAEAHFNIQGSGEVLSGAGGTGLSIIRIPVVVHILYRESEQNISDQQVLSQIEVLNKAFRHTHADTALVPAAFRSLAADCGIEFVMAKITPEGYATNGIIHKKTNAYSFGADDKIKFSSMDGSDAWDTDRYLNIWVGNMMTGIIGYSSVLGGPKNTDGVVMRYDAFGNTGRLQSPYVQGRVAVHEVGHWMGLRHIWGDQVCGTDGIDDTPPQKIATRNCPAGIIAACDNSPAGIMYNNYMDLTNDNCMNMFTVGQRERMRTAFAPGAYRYALLSSNAATATPLPGPPPSEEEPVSLVKLYPNPAAEQCVIDISKYESLLGKTVTIHNQFGQQVMSVRLLKTITIVPLHSLRNAVYFLHFGQGIKPVKLVKAG